MISSVRVALFVTCLADTLAPQAGTAVVRLLERLGHRVEFPAAQTCCGQLHLNTGYRDDALALARRFARVFEPFELVVAPSASCVGTVRHEYARLDPSLAGLGDRVLELSELLTGRLGLEDVGAAFPHRVVYHPTCHSLRVLRLGDAPYRLLRAVRGLVLRLRRDVRGQERRHVRGDPGRQGAGRPRHRRRGLHGRGQLVPAPNRRCALTAANGRPHPAPGGSARLGSRMSAAFPAAARAALRDTQLRHNLAVATRTIRDKRAAAVAERRDWEELREAGKSLKLRVLRHLDGYLTQFEQAVERGGGRVHWARDAGEANRIVVELVEATGAREVVKVKSLTTDEIGLNRALHAAGIDAVETDLAELICQLAGDEPSHILVPAIHKNRVEIRDLFRRELGLRELSDDPSELAEAARRHLRRKFLEARVAISGANFGVAETGTLCVVESEGNGRFCTTLPRTLITVLGIEKLVPAPEDLEVFLQLLPRSSTGERMNPYTSLWTGVTPGDGPQELHVILLDNGRTNVLADEIGRQTLSCIRCSACLNVCPVYSRTGGHAYGSVYPGPIGAILTPQLRGLGEASSLPYASSLCGACYEVCPVKIDIPQVLVHLRGRVVDEEAPRRERAAMRALAWTFADERRYARAQRAARAAGGPFARDGVIARLPGLGGWTATRDLPRVARPTFREWWASR
jgi:L-lactate dehydrogenase complex protein LldF